MSWRTQNILSLFIVAAILLLNCLPAHSQGLSVTVVSDSGGGQLVGIRCRDVAG